jgi:hypothetical protein
LLPNNETYGSHSCKKKIKRTLWISQEAQTKSQWFKVQTHDEAHFIGLPSPLSLETRTYIEGVWQTTPPHDTVYIKKKKLK